LFLRVNHFILNGQVRWRAPYDTRQQLLIGPPRRGSIEFSLAAMLAAEAPTTIIGQVAISATPTIVIGLALYLFKRLTGQPVDKAPEVVKAIENERPGDIAALGLSLIPPLKKAHTIINNGAGNIYVFGDKNTVRFDRSTKEYLNETIDDEQDTWLDSSIAWLNGNSKTGGAYNYELGQVIPFQIATTASRKALEILSRSASAYFVGDRSPHPPGVFVDQGADHALVGDALFGGFALEELDRAAAQGEGHGWIPSPSAEAVRC
jgi:hypothetical protein